MDESQPTAGKSVKDQGPVVLTGPSSAPNTNYISMNRHHRTCCWFSRTTTSVCTLTQTSPCGRVWSPLWDRVSQRFGNYTAWDDASHNTTCRHSTHLSFSRQQGQLHMYWWAVNKQNNHWTKHLIKFSVAERTNITNRSKQRQQCQNRIQLTCLLSGRYHKIIPQTKPYKIPTTASRGPLTIVQARCPTIVSKQSMMQNITSLKRTLTITTTTCLIFFHPVILSLS